MLKKIFFVLPFTSFIIGYLLIQFLFTSKELYVPNIVGKNLGSACEILAEQNLNIRIIGRTQDSDLPANTVLSQTPQANEKIKTHQSIYVVLSSQNSAHQAPNFVHKTLESIHPELEKLGIKPKIHYVPSSYPQNTCIAQYPRAGELLEKNSITLYCAAARTKPIIWPDLRGKPLATAKELLETIHIVPQIIAAHHTQISDSSLILDQRPKAGTLLILDENKPISVQLSIG